MFNRKDVACLAKLIIGVALFMVLSVNVVPLINYNDNSVFIPAAISVIFGFIGLVWYIFNVIHNYYSSEKTNNE